MKGASLDNSTVREFVLHYALDPEQIGTAEWKPDLSTIRECYVRGTRSNSGILLRRKGKEIDMPLHTATAIAKNPTEYPIHLLAAAEERLRESVTKGIVPVAKVAADEKWFS